MKIIRASLQGASITTQTVDAQAFIDIVGEMINHNPDSLYPKRRQLDPYSDLNYQCVEDSFDLKVRADYLTLGLRENGRNSTARILNFHLARNPEIAFLWNVADNYSNLLKTGLIQPLIRSVLDSGGFAVVFDMGDGYKSLCENMGGVYLDGETLRFNPFANITDIDQSAERVRDQLSVMASPNGTGSALMAMKDAGVNTYRWQGGEQRPATIISEPDRNVRYARLAGDFAASVKAGEESVAQVSGVRGFFPDVLCLSSYCAGRSGCVTGMMLALILLINKQHNTGYL